MRLDANWRVLLAAALIASNLLIHWWRGDGIFRYGLDGEEFEAFSGEEEGSLG